MTDNVSISQRYGYNGMPHWDYAYYADNRDQGSNFAADCRWIKEYLIFHDQGTLDKGTTSES